MRRKSVQTVMLAILYLLVIFAFISVAYSWFDVFPQASVDHAQVELINDYEVDIEWYDEDGKVIEGEVEYIDCYDQVQTKYISLENKGGIEVYSFVSFDTMDISYEFYLNRFTYTVSEIKAINNAGKAKIFKGSGVPSGDLGKNGSYYLDTTNDKFYKKTSSGWFEFTGVTKSTSKPSSPGSNDDFYLYTSASYAVLYQYSTATTSWNVVAFDALATPLDLYLVEGISLGEETVVSSGDLADLAKLLLGDSNHPNIGRYLAGTSGSGYEDGGTFFWKIEYTIISSSITSPNQATENILYLKPRLHISFGDVYEIDPIEGPVWLVENETQLLAALNEETGAANKHTVRLKANISTSQNLTIYKGITLDLNGYDLTVAGNLNYQAPIASNSVFLNIPSGSDLSVVNLNINTNATGRIYIDMGGGGKTVVSNNLNLNSPNLSVAIFGDTSVDQLKVTGLINVNVSYDEADEQRLNSSNGLSFYDLKTNTANLLVTKQEAGNKSRIFISDNSLIGTVTAEAADASSEVNTVQLVNLGTVGYIDLSNVAVAASPSKYMVDIYFDGVSTASTNQIKVPALANTDNTYLEISMNMDVLISSVSTITSYIRVFNNEITEVNTLNKFSITGSTTFTNDSISKPYYWVKFDTTGGKVLQVLKYGTIASFFEDNGTGGVYDFEPVSDEYIYFDGWYENGLEFVRNQAVTKDVVLTERMLTVDYLLQLELDSGVIDDYDTKSDMVDDFLDDYTYFYNTVNGTSLTGVNLLVPGDAGYNADTALVALMDEVGCTPTAFFNDDIVRARWLWMIEYMILIREAKGLPTTAFFGLLDNEEETAGARLLLKYEIWAFLSDKKYDVSGVTTSDYTNFGNGYDYIFFPSYPYRLSSVPFAQGGTSFVYTLPTPQRRGSHIVGGATYGYIFGGWYKDAAYTQLISGPTIDYATLVSLIPSGSTTATIYAKWVPGVAKVTFTDKSETYYNSIEAAIDASLLDVGSTITLLMNTSLDSARTINQNITLDLGIYYLTINANFTISNGSLKGSSAYLLAGTNGSILTIDNLVPIEAGVRPWSVVGNPISEFVIGGERVLDIVYTASNGSWTTNKRQVIFMYWADGDITNNVTSDLVLKVYSVAVVNQGATVTAPTAPTMSGWTFAGWNKYSGGNLIPSHNGYLYVGPSVTKANAAFNFSTAITESTVLVAWFKDTISYSIEGVTADATDDVYFGELSTVRMVDATIKKTGYRLVGWEYEISANETFECGVPYTYQAYLPHDALLKAVWIPIEYTVVFDANGGSGIMNPAYQNFVYNVPSNLYANTFVKAGYSFLRWNTKADGTGTNYSNQALVNSVNPISLTHGASIVLYAQWGVATYSITFNSSGGAGSMPNQNQTYLSTVALPTNAFTKAGHTFRGWSLNSSAQYIKFFDKQVITNEELLEIFNAGVGGVYTLYAVWVQDIYVARWTIDGTLVRSGIYLHQDSVTINITKTGYTFSGWYDNAAMLGSPVSYAGSFSMDRDMNYFGQFVANTYTLYFNANGSEALVSPTSKIVTYDSAVGPLPPALSGSSITRRNSTLVEWNTAANGSGTTYTSTTVYQVAGDLTLYAIWDFNINYSLNGGAWSWSTGTVTPANGIDSASTLPEIFMQDFYKYLYDETLLNSSLVRAEFRKTTWATFSADANDPRAWYNWTSDRYGNIGYVSYFSNDGYSQFFWNSLTFDNNLNIYKPVGGFFGTEPYKSKYSNVYDLVYELYQLKTATPSVPIYPPITSHDSTNGYGIAGFGFILDGYFYGTQGLTGTTNNTLWTDLRSTIPTPTTRYYVSGSTKYSSTTPYQVTSYRDGTIAYLKEPFRDGYLFGGWYDVATSTTVAVGSIPAGVIPADVYDALWGDVSTYSGSFSMNSNITFNKQGGTGGADSVVATYGQAMPLPNPSTPPTKTGYTFAGYYSQTGGAGTKYYNANLSSATNWNIFGPATLYAYWIPINYNLTWDFDYTNNSYPTGYQSLNGSLSGYTRTTYTIEDTFSLPNVNQAISNHPNYLELEGWYNAPDHSGAKVSAISAGTTGDKTFYAKWKPKTYTVTLTLNGGTLSGSYTEYTCFTGLTLPTSSNITRTGYIFDGWYDNSSFSGSPYTAIGTLDYGNKDFYAKWTPITYTLKLRMNSAGYVYYNKTLLAQDFCDDFNTYASRTSPPTTPSTFFTTSYTHSAMIVTMFNSSRGNIKWGWMLRYIIEVATAQNYPDLQYLTTNPNQTYYRLNIHAFLNGITYQYGSYTSADFTSTYGTGYASKDYYIYREFTFNRTYDDGQALMRVDYPDTSNNYALFSYWNFDPTLTGNDFSQESTANITTVNGATVTLYPVSNLKRRYGAGVDGDGYTYDTTYGIVYYFVNDYRLFYNAVNGASLAELTLLSHVPDGTPPYNASTAYIGRLGNANAYLSKFLNHSTYGPKWRWILNYWMAVKVKNNQSVTSLLNIMNGSTADPGASANRESWAFLRGYGNYSGFSSDYTGIVARYSYWLFLPMSVA
ncbi:MAG: InlB B-repeat-containing protein [Bacilli bacterium]